MIADASAGVRMSAVTLVNDAYGTWRVRQTSAVGQLPSVTGASEIHP